MKHWLAHPLYCKEVRNKFFQYRLVHILTKEYSLVMGLSRSGWWLNITVLNVFFNLVDFEIQCIIYIPANR